MEKNNSLWLNLVLILTIIGGLNWGLVGVFKFDLVAFIFGEMSTFSRVVYALVGVCSVLSLAHLKKANNQ